MFLVCVQMALWDLRGFGGSCCNFIWSCSFDSTILYVVLDDCFLWMDVITLGFSESSINHVDEDLLSRKNGEYIPKINH